MQIKLLLLIFIFCQTFVYSAFGQSRLAGNLGLGGGALCWSPDGKKIAYVSSQGSPHRMITNIWVMNSNGSGKRQLTTSSTWDNYPDWSPDGTKILYSSRANPSDSYQLWTMDVNGSNKRRLTFEKKYHMTPRWSPDGKEILFTSGDNRIWKMNSDGTNAQQLTFKKSLSPSWTYNKDILYAQYSAKGRHDIYLMDPEGKSNVAIINTPLYELSPELSPDGTQIIYIAWNTENNTKRISLMNANGSNSKFLTHGGMDEGSPRWSPGGSKIAYNTWRNDENELWVAPIIKPALSKKLPIIPEKTKVSKSATKTEKKSEKGNPKIINRPSSPKPNFSAPTNDSLYKIKEIFTSDDYNPGRKKAFSKRTEFDSNSEKIWVLIKFHVLKYGCNLKFDFYNPAGTLYYSTESKLIPIIGNKNGTDFSYGAFMSIKGSPAEKMKGKWNVKARIKFQGKELEPLLINNTENWHLYFHVK